MLLDIMDVPLLEHRPKDYQQENWLLDPDICWKKVDKCSWEGLDQFSEAGRDPVAKRLLHVQWDERFKFRYSWQPRKQAL